MPPGAILRRRSAPADAGECAVCAAAIRSRTASGRFVAGPCAQKLDGIGLARARCPRRSACDPGRSAGCPSAQPRMSLKHLRELYVGLSVGARRSHCGSRLASAGLAPRARDGDRDRPDAGDGGHDEVAERRHVDDVDEHRALLGFREHPARSARCRPLAAKTRNAPSRGVVAAVFALLGVAAIPRARRPPSTSGCARSSATWTSSPRQRAGPRSSRAPPGRRRRRGSGGRAG